ncbi:MAG: hypothetical protein GVY32_02875 [Gammaproteobacteria bacterium]|nr:hypothetical protein [Gammaproteobacteria bacterium]
MNTATTRLATLALIALIAAGCTGNVREVVGKAPLVGIDGVQRSDSEIALEIALRNVNDRPLTLSGIAVELSLDERGPVRIRQDLSLSIAPRGREVITLSLPAERAPWEALESLSDGQHNRLPWQMSLQLFRPGESPMSAETEGWLHPVPGQRDRFR